MDEGCEVSVTRTDRTVVVTLRGELDLYTVPHVRDELAQLETETQLIVDLRGLDFVDSTGLNVLIGLDQRGRAAGRRVRFVPASKRVHRVFVLTALDERLAWIEPEELP